MAKKNQTTALTVQGSDMNEVMDLVNAEIQSLKHIQESAYRTNGQIEGFSDIRKEMKIENLIRAFASVKVREEYYVSAAKELGLKEWPAFTISGNNVEDLKKDIMLRIDIINHQERLDKLNEFKSRAEGLMSEADKKNRLFEEMKGYFGKK